MKQFSVRLATFLVSICLCSQAFPQYDAAAQNSPDDLVKQVASNELADRAQRLKWMYCVEKRENGHTLTEKQLETKDGPIYRLLSIDHGSLNPEQLKRDRSRLESTLNDPKLRKKLKNDHDEDESKLQRLIGILPDAFHYEFAGREGSLVTLKFRPNPRYSPATYEMRIANQLGGTIVVDEQQKRLVKLTGTLAGPVDYGFGLLGHVEKGGKIEIVRTQVGPGHWKTSLINIHMDGRILILKSVSKQQNESRYHFENIPNDLSLRQAETLLFSNAYSTGCSGQ